MKLIFEKKFRLKDTLQYAKKSGDKNKIHIKNDVHKYSNFKRPIVHGCLVVENVYSKIKNLNQFKIDLYSKLLISLQPSCSSIITLNILSTSLAIFSASPQTYKIAPSSSH